MRLNSAVVARKTKEFAEVERRDCCPFILFASITGGPRLLSNGSFVILNEFTQRGWKVKVMGCSKEINTQPFLQT
jgi:hypothetical protein